MLGTVFSCLAAVVPVVSNWSGQGWLAGIFDSLYFLALPILILVLGLRYSARVLSLLGSLVTTLSLVFPIACLLYYAKLEMLFSPYAASAILQTDKIEAKEFIVSYLGSAGIITLFFLLIVLLWFFFKLYHWVLSSRNQEFWPLVIPFGCALIFTLGVVSSLTVVGKSFTQAFLNRGYLDEFVKDADLRKELIKSEIVTGGEENIALVIGESHTASHWPREGYGRNTAPWLETMLQGSQALYFPHAYSCGTHTAAVLPMFLTEQNQYNGLSLAESWTLPETAQQAGYQVIWLSNQAKQDFGAFVGSQCNQQFWVQGKLSHGTDMDLVNVLLDLKKPTKKTLYILQLAGSHVQYSARYPAEFTVWQGRNKLDEYDNSLVYHDRVMHCLYKELMGRLGVEALLYIPDHGEEAGTYFHHGDDLFLHKYRIQKKVQDIVHIPMYLLYSEEYGEKKFDLMKVLRSHQEYYFTNDLAYDLLLGLMGIEGKCYHEEFDLSSIKYNRKKENLTLCKGKVPLSALP